MNINEMNLELIESNIKVLRQVKENPNLIVEVCAPGNKGLGIKTSTDWEYYYLNDFKFRIKPEPQYRPYTEVKEEWIGKKVIPLNENTSRINTITDIDLTMNEVAVYSHWKTMYNMFENYIWGNNGDENDGKPFGEN
jgi:phosphatidate phosphatase APP1